MQRKVGLNVEEVFEYGKWVVTALLAVISAIPELTWFLLSLMVMDSVLGLLVSIREKRIDPEKIANSTTRKVGVVLAISLGALLDRYVNPFDVQVVYLVTAYAIWPEALRILKKFAVLEVPVPPQLERVLAMFKEEEGEDGTVPQNSNRAS